MPYCGEHATAAPGQQVFSCPALSAEAEAEAPCLAQTLSREHPPLAVGVNPVAQLLPGCVLVVLQLAAVPVRAWAEKYSSVRIRGPDLDYANRK